MRKRAREREKVPDICLLLIPLCEALAAFTINPSCIVCTANTIENNCKKQFLFIFSKIIVFSSPQHRKHNKKWMNRTLAVKYCSHIKYTGRNLVGIYVVDLVVTNCNELNFLRFNSVSVICVLLILMIHRIYLRWLSCFCWNWYIIYNHFGMVWLGWVLLVGNVSIFHPPTHHRQFIWSLATV